MPKVYIIEGPDGSGKTSLANALCEEVNGQYIHTENCLEKQRDHYLEINDQIIAWYNQNRNVVVDRWWQSEYCYNKALNRTEPNRPDFGFEHGLLKDINKWDIKTIFCLPDSISRWVNDVYPCEEGYTIEQLRAVYAAYIEIAWENRYSEQTSPIVYNRYDYQSPLEFIKILKQYDKIFIYHQSVMDDHRRILP